MSPELETLDQLLGGDLPLSVVRQFFPSDDHFTCGLHSLLNGREIELLDARGLDVPMWRVTAFLEGRENLDDSTKVAITPTGIERIR
jgi:hypothetical protein